MKQEHRFILFIALSFLILLGTQPVLEWLGIVRRPQPNQAEEAAVAGSEAPAPARIHAFAGEPDGPTAFAAGGGAAVAVAEPPAGEEAAEVAAADEPKVEAVQTPLVLGEADAKAEPGRSYAMRVALSQEGAGVGSITLAHYAAETIRGRPRDERLRLVNASSLNPAYALSLVVPGEGPDVEDRVIDLTDRRWEVVPDDQGRLVRPVSAGESGQLPGQEVVFRTEVEPLGVTVTKTFRLRRGLHGFHLILGFASREPRTIAYRLSGPHGLPIEGAWYTTTFREVYFGKLNGQATEVETHLATEVVDKEAKGDPVRVTTLPLKFAGVENQYFASFFEPDPVPEKPADRLDEMTVAEALAVPADKRRADVTVVMTSKPIDLAGGGETVHAYRVFAGPKTSEALMPFGADDLAVYRKGWSLPGTSWIAKNVITPLLGQIYGATRSVAGVFGGQRGSWGLAIILLTITVRLALFPLSRKQAVAAKKMQDLQPKMLAIREKYKEDKERLSRETMEIYRQAGVNPFGGCLLAIVQMPIFFGLWQALNNSVDLRGASFLWIDNLAAPDMLFKFPVEIPFLGPYFNLLPILVVVLMLVHMKLFSPPPASPEQAQSQKMMKYMMIFMAYMFYWVPSGLGIYFITSSTWAIAERLLLPKHLKTHAPPGDEGPGKGGSGGKPGPLPPGKPAPAGNGKGGWRDRLRERLEEAMEAANQDRTHRNVAPGKTDKDRKSRPKPKPGKRR